MRSLFDFVCYLVNLLSLIGILFCEYLKCVSQNYPAECSVLIKEIFVVNTAAALTFRTREHLWHCNEQPSVIRLYVMPRK